MTRLVLIRHGECEGAGTYIGRGSDVPLTGEGRDSLRRTGQILREGGYAPTRIITSSLHRAIESGHILAGELGIGPSPRSCPPDSRLDETDFGLFEGLTYGEIIRDYPFPSNLWFKDPWRNAPPGGETAAETLDRVRSFYGDLMRALSGEDRDLLVVAHGGSLRLLICLLLAVDPESHWHFRLDRGGRAHFEITGDFPVLTELARGEA